MQIENIFSLLWLAILLPLAGLLALVIRWKKLLSARLGESRLIQPLLSSYSPGKFMMKACLTLGAFALLCFAVANVRKPDSTEKVRLSGTDLMIALDVSNSMMAKDISPNRLEKSKLLISKLIDQLEGNRMGLVVFAGNAYLQMPLTTDASAAKLFLSTISPDLVPLQGTNISDALKLCNRSLNNEDKKYKSILLISDGEDHDDAAISTAKELKNFGVVINTVGVGSPAGAPIDDPATNELKRDDQGNVVMTKLNEKELNSIASASNGTYQLLNEADAAAAKITDQLRSMDKKPITDTTLTNYTSFYWVFVLFAIGLLVTEMLTGENKRKNKIDDSITNNGNKLDTKNRLSKAASLMALLLFVTIGSASGQKEAELLRKGNEAYQKQQFGEAQKQYEAALRENSSNAAANFNLGNAQFKSGKFEEASKQYDALAGSATDKHMQAQSLYNKGVSLVKQKKLPEAIDAFKQSLRQEPQDEVARQNLQKALNELKQQQQQQPQKKDDKKKDDKKKEDKKEDPKKEEKQDQKDQQQQPQPRPKINKEDAEQKLQALRQEEKKLQQKMNQRQKSSVRQPEKDW